MNLEYFQTSKVLSRRHARWSEILSAYDFVIEHLEGTKNPADGPSRHPDYEIGYERPVARLLATAPVEPYDDLMPAIIAAQASDFLAIDVFAKLVNRPVADSTDTAEKVTQWEVVVGALTYKGRIYVPAVDSLRGKVISLFHDNPESGHFGALKTTQLESRDFTGQQWTCTYIGTSAAAKYATESKHLGMPGMGSIYPSRHHHGHGKASRWTSSLTCQSHQH